MTRAQAPPRVIQGGMAAAVSGWRLASSVSRTGQLGVVSGTALAVILARGLQDGDPGGHLRRGLAAFADREVAARIEERYFRPGGRPAGGAYRAVPVPRQRPSRHFLELAVTGSFVEVYLAKDGHRNPVGMNLLEKIQIATLPSLYGAMLAGVDWVLMGAGIPVHIPGALDALAEHRAVSLPLAVAGAAPGAEYTVDFDPRRVMARPGTPLTRPRFMAIVGSHVLATHLAGDATSRPDGFVVERPTAGGHNAPPRGRLQLNADGEPIYGPRDEVDPARMRKLGVPFWLAGGYGHPEKLREALAVGASGVQVGTAFALCEESGLDPALRRSARERAAAGRLAVRTDPGASPAGFPFKVAGVAGSVADPAVYRARPRRCDISYLATPYRRSDGSLGYRCPAEPTADYLAKGGAAEETVGRVCLCNGLVAAAGLAQRGRDGAGEPPLVTLGDDVRAVVAELSPDGRPYHASDVVRHVLGEATAGDDAPDPVASIGEERAMTASTVEGASPGAVAGLFPGQGSQTADDLGERVRRVLPELAERCCELVGEDPFARLRESTRFAQPAIFCASVASYAELRERVSLVALAGHSLGELSALVAADAIDPYTGLELAVRRGELMAVTETGTGEAEGMLAVLGASEEQLALLVGEHRIHLANDNAPGQVVLAGSLAGLRAASKHARGLGVRAIQLDVAGAFHSPSMAGAVEAFREALGEVAFRAPAIPVISGSTARPFVNVRAELADAIVRPVRWRATMLTLAELGADTFVDFGPGEVLARLVPRNLPDAAVMDVTALAARRDLESTGVA
ncbi:MAG: acyltransferase domain-containing protein [Acidobacteriota bacterium]|nr:acyltransferase domain-containing protein [Acidobacteriota bacterium]